MTARVAFSVAEMRVVPAGFSRSSLSEASSVTISSSLDPALRSRRSPASDGATLRVNSRSPDPASCGRSRTKPSLLAA
jgi:hypothetical protein